MLALSLPAEGRRSEGLKKKEGLKYIKETSLSGGRMVRLQTWMNIASALLICAVVAGCDSNLDFEPYPQTRILRVDVNPNPVVEGDTVTFTCVIADSLDERFQFTWSGRTFLPDTTTQKPVFKWKARKLNDGLPYVPFIVRANNQSPDSQSVIRSFSVYFSTEP
jgi:hypothetical protein